MGVRMMELIKSFSKGDINTALLIMVLGSSWGNLIILTDYIGHGHAALEDGGEIALFMITGGIVLMLLQQASKMIVEFVAVEVSNGQ